MQGSSFISPRRRVPTTWVAILAFMLSAFMTPGSPDAKEHQPPGPTQRWIEIRTANFTFFSNAGLGPTKRVAVDLEELRAVLSQLTDFELQSPVPTYIFVFRHDRSFKPYKLLYEGQPGVMSGYFVNRDRANYIAINAGSRDASGVVFHEYVHYVTAMNFWWIPVWLSEGLAMFYQTLQVVDDTVYIGLPIRSHLATLRGSTRVPLGELLQVTHDSPMYNERDQKGAFYAQSWALTHYLLLGNEERRRQLERYLAMIRTGVPSDEAFVRSFGTDFEELDREVRGHIRSPRFPFLQSTTEVDVDETLTVREMDYSDVLYHLGDLLSIQEPPRPEAMMYFEAALEAEPGHSPSLTALAIAAEDRADWRAAADAYASAVRANPDNPDALYHWGEFLSRRGGDPQRAVAALTRATELRPSYAPAWAALSRLYVTLGSSSPQALEAAETAHRLEPSNQIAAQSLLRLYLRLDNRQGASRLIEASFESSRPTASEAWMAVLQNDVLRARQLLHEDRPDAALARLDEAEGQLDLAARPEIIERGIADVRRSISEHDGAKGYDRAMALYDAGKQEEARSLLVEILDEVPADSPVARSCLHLIRVIDHPEEFRQPAASEISPTRDEINQLNRLLAATNLEDAKAYLVDIRSRSTGAQTRWIDAKIEELQRTLDYNRYVDGYNRAVDLYNREVYSQAIAVLEELLATLPPDSPQAASARALLEDAEAAAEGP